MAYGCEAPNCDLLQHKDQEGNKKVAKHPRLSSPKAAQAVVQCCAICIAKDKYVPLRILSTTTVPSHTASSKKDAVQESHTDKDVLHYRESCEIH